MPKRKTVMIVDDHPLFREGVKSLLGRHSSHEVVAEATTGEEALAKVAELKPDIVIMDISLPDSNGLDVTCAIRRTLPRTRVVILSVHLRVDFITRAFQSGASGYITKESASERLLECLESVSKGDLYMDPILHTAIVQNVMKSSAQKSVTHPCYSSLTPRELEVLRFLAEGLSAKEVAGKLYVSPKTVENHRSKIMKKLDLHTAVELVRYAAKFGMIDVSLWKK